MPRIVALDAYVSRVVAEAPPLSPEKAQLIAYLLRPEAEGVPIDVDDDAASIADGGF